LITGILSFVIGIDVIQWKLASLIFLLSAIAAILISRLLVLPRVRGKDGPEPMSGEAVIGKIMTVQEVNKKHVVRYEGVYWNISSKDTTVAGDKVKITAMEDNHLIVKK
jgi:membrane protein implicated in regulation of membrane protease activity